MKIILSLLALCHLSFADEIYASFSVEAVMRSKLSLESTGIVKELRVGIADKVKKGEVLLKLNDESELIALENAKNDYKLALKEFENAQNKMKKFQSVRSVIDVQSYEDVQTAFHLAKLKLEKTKINIRHYKNLLEKKQLLAPYDGVISHKFVQVGEGVGGVGKVLLELYSYPEVKLVLSFDEKYKHKIKIGQIFRYKLDGDEKEFEGKIALIYPAVEEKTRKIYAEVYAKDLSPGLFGEGKIITDK